MSPGGLAWGSHPPSGAPFEGRHEIGDRCPNCDYPIDVPVQGEFPTAVESIPSTGNWTCSHCGWTMRAAFHGNGTESQVPRPGRP